MSRLVALACAAAALLLAVPVSHAGPSPDDDEVARAHWEARARAVRDQHRAAERRYREAVAAFDRMNSRRWPRGEARAAIIAERDAAEKALAEATRALEALPEEARRAGALPGWIRPDPDPEPGPAARP